MNHGLRSGFTTGTSAAVAAKAAAALLIAGEKTERETVRLPGGDRISQEIGGYRLEEGRAGCFVRKDSGDDPDVTNGMEIWVWVSRLTGREMERENWYTEADAPGLYLSGGEGVGVVTRPGLSCPVGKHAINPVPRSMVFQAVREVCRRLGETGELLIVIEFPQGRELAAKTFNPNLGIIDGLSVLGTSGVVEPMSAQALIDTIRLEIHMQAAAGRDVLILTPGNYGERFLQEQMRLNLKHAVVCSNFFGEAFEAAAGEGIRRVLLTGHIGKLIKVAAGMKNTHSMYGDHRMETLCLCLEEAGNCDGRLAEQIRDSNTTEEAVKILRERGMLEPVMEKAVERIVRETEGWAGKRCQTEVVTFSSVYGILGMTKGARELADELRGLTWEDEQ